MLKRYKEFLKIFDKKLDEYFKSHKDYIKCQKGCNDCCKAGEYPFSRLEAEYLMSGFVNLPPDTQKLIKKNIKELLEKKSQSNTRRFSHKCPFLVDELCSLYNYRGLTCRVFGLAYLKNGVVKLPECANSGLNYNDNFNPETKELTLKPPLPEPLGIDDILRNPLAESFNLECGEIRPILDWFKG